jgi:hypothetical protein
MITIGAYFGGPELHESPVQLMIRSAMKVCKHIRGDWAEGSTPAVNVVFYVTGSLDTYASLRQIEAARFSPKKNLLLVAVPVPSEVAKAGGSVEFITDSLHRANAIATEVFARKGTEPFDFAKAEAIVEMVRQSLLAQAK